MTMVGSRHRSVGSFTYLFLLFAAAICTIALIQSYVAAPTYGAGEGVGAYAPLPTQELAPICRVSGQRIVVVYAHPPGQDTTAPVEEIRSAICTGVGSAGVPSHQVGETVSLAERYQ